MSPTTELPSNAKTTITTDNDGQQQQHADRSRPPTPHNSSQEDQPQVFDWSDIDYSDRPLVQSILSKIEQLDDAERIQRQIIVLISDKLSPMLKYHAELISEILRVLPGVENAPAQAHEEHNSEGDDCSSSLTGEIKSNLNNDDARDHNARVLSVVLSPKSDSNNIEMLAEPFHLDLFDRMNLAEIQVAASPASIRSRLVLDDSWACLSNRVREPRGTDAVKEYYVQMLRNECCRMEDILAWVTELAPEGTGPLELYVVMEQPEAELHGVAVKIPGKVVFIVSKDREVRPKSVALKTSVHWLDRMFLRAGYTEEWVRSSLIPLYIQLPREDADVSLEGQRPESRYRGTTIHLTGKRPEEALVRVKVRQGCGGDFLEESVLMELERTKLFEMQVIRKPSFLERLEVLSLSDSGQDRLGGGVASSRGDGHPGDDEGESNPFM
ncbi:hypothetical protein EC957_008094 [Mortierella hygrophila]|uniref:Uncharacterized protein n=1 Tax=Mortierella hygrophila TaxID=979708 RepID=A0A9P6EXT1_9FUNG|nr:hypothetical protein EC957_008094 [Mortierella hygrophila]